ncbi:hypothetical protein EVAR_76582_1 [Eumeta japonica]|uniref:Uncharacterized protein n=1 Tax=Eumeta variegata TaxID=151549 RepID=A0A4C1T7Y6_EUMVA|nr:hypothetical protein EVAR_76582_1 [Eumeta japonica]
MSILHTLAPVRSVETSRRTSQTTLIASPSAAERHMRVPTARDMADDAWRSRLSMDVAGNRHGSVPSPARPEAVSGARWSAVGA